MVVTAISGGPSDALGIQPGDRIIEVEGKNVANIHISNSQVMQSLRGPSSTKVNVVIYRKGKKINYSITRGKIPIYSVDVAYMLSKETGYIKVSHFGDKTFEEKKPIYSTSKFAITKKISDPQWHSQNIKSRQAHLAKLATAIWKIQY